eukprot:COSAG02_NODE_6546_length_3503_cov_2.314336_3_plen_39_part_00
MPNHVQCAPFGGGNVVLSILNAGENIGNSVQDHGELLE